MRKFRLVPTTLLLTLVAACAHPESSAKPLAIGLDQQAAGSDPYLAGRDALSQGAIGLAVEQFRRALRSDPDSVPALNGLAVSYDEIGRFDVAQDLYHRALNLAPQSVQTLNNLGRSLIRQGDAGSAVPYLSLARERAQPPLVSVVEGNLHLAQQSAAGVPSREANASSAAPLERTGAREHLLHTGAAAPRPLVAVGELARPAESESPRQAPTSWAVEISNGAGRSRMAARMGSFLRAKDVPVKRLTNADNFAHQETLVLFRPGQEAHASWVAALLPVPARTVPVDQQATDVRVLLGLDLLTFHRALLAQGAGS